MKTQLAQVASHTLHPPTIRYISVEQNIFLFQFNLAFGRLVVKVGNKTQRLSLGVCATDITNITFISIIKY